jgi:PHS family inorganic phosphate transporter-like MFS transporter
LLFLVFAVPGYILAAKYVDRLGRKSLQVCGFLIMGVCYTLIALIPHVAQHLTPFIIIFGLSFFFVNFGPNSTTFLIPSEIYPTKIRARAHGISAAVGKIGAFAGAFILPPFLHLHGLSFTIAMMAYVALAGALITLLVPEMKQVSLDKTEV